MPRKKTDKPATPRPAADGAAPTFPIDVDARDGEVLPLLERDGLDATRHRLDRGDLHAINAAIAAERPLLLRGDPGTGKSQLARAAAELLQRRFRWKVVDAHTEVSDLFYSFDAVARLAYAQILGAVTKTEDPKVREQVMEELGVCHFLRPGPLWWAFEEDTAATQEDLFRRRCGGPRVQPGATTAPPTGDDRRGWVVLIDEIDKADPSVPNGLLEALGQGTFEVPGGATISLHRKGQSFAGKPLVVITTNEERELPSAFVRRCMVRTITVPGDEQSGSEPEEARNRRLHQWLVERGETHFGKKHLRVLKVAADMVVTDRRAAQRLGVTPPGQAEFLDLVRAALRLGDPEAALQSIGEFALKKHPDQASVQGRR